VAAVTDTITDHRQDTKAIVILLATQLCSEFAERVMLLKCVGEVMLLKFFVSSVSKKLV